MTTDVHWCSTCISFPAVHFIVNIHGELFKLVVTELEFEKAQKRAITQSSCDFFLRPKTQNDLLDPKGVKRASPTGASSWQLWQTPTDPGCFGGGKETFTLVSHPKLHAPSTLSTLTYFFIRQKNA